MKRIVSIMLLIATINCFTMEETPRRFCSNSAFIKQESYKKDLPSWNHFPWKFSPQKLTCKYIIFEASRDTAKRSNQGALIAYNTQTGKRLWSKIVIDKSYYPQKINCTLSPHKNFLAIHYYSPYYPDALRFVIMFEMATGREMWRKETKEKYYPCAEATRIKFSPDENTVFIKNQAYNVTTGLEEKELASPLEEKSTLPPLKLQVVKKPKLHLKLYNSKTKKLIRELQLPDLYANLRLKEYEKEFSPQGEYVAVSFSFINDVFATLVYNIKMNKFILEKKPSYEIYCMKFGPQDYFATMDSKDNLQLYNLQTSEEVWKNPIKHVENFDFCTDERGVTKLVVVKKVNQNFEIQTYTFPKEQKWQEEDPKERVSFTKEMLLEEKPEDVDLRGFGLPGFGPAGIKFVPKKQTTRKAPPVPPVRPKKTYEKKTITKRTKGPKQLFARITGQRGMKYTVKTEDGKKFECFIPKKFRNIKRSDIEKLHIKPSGRHNQATIIKVFKKQ